MYAISKTQTCPRRASDIIILDDKRILFTFRKQLLQVIPQSVWGYGRKRNVDPTLSPPTIFLFLKISIVECVEYILRTKYAAHVPFSIFLKLKFYGCR